MPHLDNEANCNRNQNVAASEKSRDAPLVATRGDGEAGLVARCEISPSHCPTLTNTSLEDCVWSWVTHPSSPLSVKLEFDEKMYCTLLADSGISLSSLQPGARTTVVSSALAAPPSPYNSSLFNRSACAGSRSSGCRPPCR